MDLKVERGESIDHGVPYGFGHVRVKPGGGGRHASLRDDRPTLKVGRPDAVDHLTAASNVAALIETIAEQPGRRVLNVADPDAPTAAAIVGRIAELTGWRGRLELLTEEPRRSEARRPWFAEHPIVLDTSAVEARGYTPAGTALDLLSEEADWVLGRHE